MVPPSLSTAFQARRRCLFVVVSCSGKLQLICYNILCFSVLLKTSNRRGTQFHAEQWSSFVLSSHLDPIGDQNDELLVLTHCMYLAYLVLYLVLCMFGNIYLCIVCLRLGNTSCGIQQGMLCQTKALLVDGSLTPQIMTPWGWIASLVGPKVNMCRNRQIYTCAPYLVCFGAWCSIIHNESEVFQILCYRERRGKALRAT